MRPATTANIRRQAELAAARVEAQIQRDNLRDLKEWADEALKELRAMHEQSYGDKCRGGCPTHYIIDGLGAALAKF